MKLILFDLDGTLAQSTCEIEKNMLDKLHELKNKYDICLVSGGTYEKIINQIGGKKNEQLFSHIFSENGIVTYKNGQLFHENDIKNVYSESLLQQIINFVLIYIANLELPFKRGNFISFRKGLLYVIPIGGDCSKEERQFFSQYDFENEIRKKMIQILQAKFENENISFKIGGQIGIGIHPKEWDKSYILRIINIEDYDKVFFFGDRCEIDGNDYELYSHSKIKGYYVKNPQETLALLEIF